MDFDKLLKPDCDIIFKNIFGHNEEIFCGFVNDILDLKENKKIRRVTFLNLECPTDDENDKLSRLDVLAECENKERIHVEVQIKANEIYEKRALYYWARNYNSPLKQKMRYFELKKTISIHILSSNIYKNHKNIAYKYICFLYSLIFLSSYFVPFIFDVL
jgi:predicted transposase/invertase (TIGR01784 family)